MANKYFVQTYKMPQGCNAWMQADRTPTVTNEDGCYATWRGFVDNVNYVYPKARMIRTLNRRTAEQAFNDRESSICSREWLIVEKDKPSWKYRVTMYVIKAA